MTTPEDIDAFFDALVDSVAAADDAEESQQHTVGLSTAESTSGGSQALAAASESTETAPDAAGTALVSSDPGDAPSTLPTAPVVEPSLGAAPAAVQPAKPVAQPSQSTLSKPPDRQCAGSCPPSAPPQQAPLQQAPPPHQQQKSDEAYACEPPELRSEPPYAYRQYGDTEEGRQQHAADAEMETAALCSSALAVSRLIESKLKENEQVLFAIHENMTVGRFGEALCYFERLQQNLLFLAMLADQHRGGLTEGSLEAQQQAFYGNRDFWSHEEMQRLHHALRTPGQDLQQLAVAVGSKSPAQILSYLSHAADRHLVHRAAAGPAAAAVASAVTAIPSPAVVPPVRPAAGSSTTGPMQSSGATSLSFLAHSDALRYLLHPRSIVAAALVPRLGACGILCVVAGGAVAVALQQAQDSQKPEEQQKLQLPQQQNPVPQLQQQVPQQPNQTPQPHTQMPELREQPSLQQFQQQLYPAATRVPSSQALQHTPHLAAPLLFQQPPLQQQTAAAHGDPLLPNTGLQRHLMHTAGLRLTTASSVPPNCMRYAAHNAAASLLLRASFLNVACPRPLTATSAPKRAHYAACSCGESCNARPRSEGQQGDCNTGVLVEASLIAALGLYWTLGAG
ncbi:uncharacterized protein LOC34622797 [Cyclospora cayetanensis]|uniref:Uncharacterized protein LOC34622797 n=1 Tax=Cyclospora cayetanensis TaxID=88456 RepID=A0A6P6RYY4_9EIME|nr:uncharacterized protein LOC34622797 [Cyclospora cayetanensis]